MTIRALLASTCLATALATGVPAFAQDGTYGIEEIDAIYYVTWLEATVRESPSSMSAPITNVFMGERIPVTGWVNGTDWVRVTFDDGTTGFMWSGVLSPAVVAGADFADGTGAAIPGGTAQGADGAGNSVFDAHEIGLAPSVDLAFDDFVGANDLDDYYAIDVPDWTLIDLALEGLSADADLLLLDDSDNIVGSSEIAGWDSEYVQQVVPAGRYYIQVTSYEGDTDYTLYVYTEPTAPPPPDTIGDTIDTATMIEPPVESPQVFDERLDLSDRDDWYAFTLPDFTEVSVSLYGLQSDLDLAIVDQDGNPVATSDNGARADEYASAILGPGTHYVHVYVYAGQSDYTLEISGTPSAPPPPDGAGNTMTDALDLGTLDAEQPDGSISVADWVGPGDPDDYFAFTLDTAATLEVQLTDIVADLDLELLDADGEIVSVSNNSGNAAEMIGQSVEAGTYYVHVYAFDGNSDFTLTISAVPQP